MALPDGARGEPHRTRPPCRGLRGAARVYLHGARPGRQRRDRLSVHLPFEGRRTRRAREVLGQGLARRAGPRAVARGDGLARHRLAVPEPAVRGARLTRSKARRYATNSMSIAMELRTIGRCDNAKGTGWSVQRERGEPPAEGGCFRTVTVGRGCLADLQPSR